MRIQWKKEELGLFDTESSQQPETVCLCWSVLVQCMCLFVCFLLSASFVSVYPCVWSQNLAARWCLESRVSQSAICHQPSYIDSDSVIVLLSCRLWTHMSENLTQTPELLSLHQYTCVWERQSVPDGSVHVKLFIRPHANELCVFVHACQCPRGTTGLRNYLNGHSCNSITTGCFNGRTLWAREQGNDCSGRWNALILSQWWEGMLPLSDGLIAPALIDRQHRPLRSPGNRGPPLPHRHTQTKNLQHCFSHITCSERL